MVAREGFERDIEEDLYSEMLDFATDHKPKSSVVNLLGPAGYGTSTILMTLAARLVREQAGSVFFLRPNQGLLEGDIEFAIAQFDSRPFFFLDNAADHGRDLKIVLSTATGNEKSCPVRFRWTVE